MNEMRTVSYPGEEDLDMEFSTAESEDRELSPAALEELTDNKGEDD